MLSNTNNAPKQSNFLAPRWPTSSSKGGIGNQDCSTWVYYIFIRVLLQFMLLHDQYFQLPVNPRFKHRGLIIFMVHNHPGSNWERAEIETINLLKLWIWTGKLAWV